MNSTMPKMPSWSRFNPGMWLGFLILIVPVLVFGSGGEAHNNIPHVDGTTLSIWWVLPFAGILLSIAVFPLIAPEFWHHHYGKVSFFWAVMLIVPFYVQHGLSVTLYELLHIVLLDYIPFIILLFALFTISGGIRLTGQLVGSPKVNLGLLILGTILASWMGTTGAAMLLIRPLLRANRWRKYQVHVVVFFYLPGSQYRWIVDTLG